MKVSYFNKATQNKPSKQVSLDDWLKDTISPSNELKSLVLKYRMLKSKRLKSQIPCITVSATFKKIRNLKKIHKKTGLICIDIDKEQNPFLNIAAVKEFISKTPSVMYVGFSVGGEGIYIVIKVDKKVSLKKYFKFIKNRLRTKGIIIDESCKDYTRLRFFSYDPDAYYNPNCETLLIPKKRKIQGGGIQASKTDADKVETVISLIESNSVDITSVYNDWIKIAGSLYNAFGESGRDYFHRVSRFHPEYKPKKTDRKYDGCTNMKSLALSTFFYIANYHGIRY